MLGITIERNSAAPLARQIHGQIAALILAARLRGGEALPSTRGLAASLGVSRNTVNDAYEMLWAEGYIVSRPGSGFRVRERIALEKSPHRRAPAPVPPPSPPMAIRYDFRTGIPDLRHFPFSAWRRMQRDVLETIKPGDMLYGNTRGYEPLRTAIADWLLRFRGMRVDREGVFVTSGATRAISLAVEALCRDGRGFLVENPSHIGIARLLRLKGVPFTLCGVDGEGLRIAGDGAKAEDVAGVYVTPSHQFPLGCVLSAPRRARLVALAREKDFYIVEDDYDSEFRYGGQALSPVHSLDPDRVIYVGTFSKTLFPALRVGFAVVPHALRKAWLDLHRYAEVQNGIVDQVTLHRFLEQRGMDRHIKTMTRLYCRKRARVIAAVGDAFGSAAEVLGDGAGLHFALRLPGQRFGKAFRERCRDAGLHVMPCSRYVPEGTEYEDTLLIGYGNVEEERIAEGIRLLRKVTETAAEY